MWHLRIRKMKFVSELVAVGVHEVEIIGDGAIYRVGGLDADTAGTIDGVAYRTLPDVGEHLATVTTVNDVHLGEIECGKIVGVVEAAFRVQPGETPYATFMSEAVIEDMRALSPDAVIVKGDLTSFGTRDEFDAFRALYEPAFGDRLTYVRGNHDSYPGEVYADWPVQIVDVPGARIILLDTSRVASGSGYISRDQIDATAAAADEATTPVIVMGHHPLFVDGAMAPERFDGVNPTDSAALLAALLPRRHVVSYSAGHTHRCHRVDVDGLAVTQVACVKDFPGAWAEYHVGTRGIAQTVHRASRPDAVAWAETTRTMFDGFYGAYAMGELRERCFTLPLER